MNAPASISITQVRVADLLVEGERMPVYVHVIDHPDGRVLVDTGMTELHPAVADLDPRLRPLGKQEFNLAGIDIVVNTHLYFDHTRGMRVVVVETGGRPVVVGGDVAVWSGELDEPHTEGQLRVRALDPELVWLAQAHQPWRPRTVIGSEPASSKQSGQVGAPVGRATDNPVNC
jgi:N-acyl homoserine lactone hydrolase